MERPSPRVNSAMLVDCVGKTVRLTGKVISLDGDTALLEASDKGQVTVKLNRESNLSDAYVEIIGRVSDESTIAEFTSVNMGNNIDMDLVERVAQMTHRHPEIFPLDS